VIVWTGAFEHVPCVIHAMNLYSEGNEITPSCVILMSRSVFY